MNPVNISSGTAIEMTANTVATVIISALIMAYSSLVDTKLDGNIPAMRITCLTS
jgi:hypothetical protein